jgi:long-chain acyl-CoA synthetase
MNLGNLLTASALRNPHKAALIPQEESVSYEQLDATTTSLAQALLAQGYQPGARIAYHWPNSIEMAKLLFSCFKAGLIAVPINLLLKAPEIGHMLAKSGAAMWFTPPSRVSVVREAAQGCARREIHTSVDAMCDTNSEMVLPGVKSDDAALILECFLRSTSCH